MTNKDLIRQFLTGTVGKKTSINGLRVKGNELWSSADTHSPIASLHPGNIVLTAHLKASRNSSTRTEHIKQVRKHAEDLKMTMIKVFDADLNQLQERTQALLNSATQNMNAQNRIFRKAYDELLETLKEIDMIEKKIELPKNQTLLNVSPEFDELWEQLLKNPAPYEKDREYLTKKYVLSRMFAKKEKKNPITVAMNLMGTSMDSATNQLIDFGKALRRRTKITDENLEKMDQALKYASVKFRKELDK